MGADLNQRPGRKKNGAPDAAKGTSHFTTGRMPAARAFGVQGDIKPEAFLRIVTESCVLPPGVGGQAQQITHPQRTAKAIARVSIRPITSHIMIPWIKIRVRESRVRPAKPARVFDNSETNDAKK